MPVNVDVPDTSKLPFTSIKVALTSTSSVAFISKVVAFGALIFCEESLNCNCLVLFNNKPVSATCVRLTSLSAPKFNIAPSEAKDKSSPTEASPVTVKFVPTVKAAGEDDTSCFVTAAPDPAPSLKTQAVSLAAKDAFAPLP